MSLLFADPTPPPTPERIELRCCSLEDVDWPEADLVIADPAWKYSQRFAEGCADDHYVTVPTPKVVEHLERFARLAPRLALWVTGPLLDEWTEASRGWAWGGPVTVGTWTKSDEGDAGHYGSGYHWAGCAELVLVYTSRAAYTDRSQALRNAWVARPDRHSRKPVQWQAQWLRRWVPEGGLVLDPYAGLASVAEATIRAGGGRRYLGTELSPGRHTEARALLAQVRHGR